MDKKNKRNSRQNPQKGLNPNFHYFIGVDVSKLKLNGSLLMQGRIINSFEVTNDLKGFKDIAAFVRCRFSLFSYLLKEPMLISEFM